jgi:hypothetical protein
MYRTLRSHPPINKCYNTSKHHETITQTIEQCDAINEDLLEINDPVLFLLDLRTTYGSTSLAAASVPRGWT